MSGIINPTLNDLNTSRSNFASHYSVSGVAAFGQDIVINWALFKTAVEVQGGIADIPNIVLKFIHCYDPLSHLWYLVMQVCHLASNGKNIDQLGARFTLKSGLPPTASALTTDYDPNYFAHVLYNGTPVNKSVNVNYVVMPWICQIKDMSCENGLTSSAVANIKFSCASFDYTANVPASSLVAWPHTICAFMNTTTNGDYVNNNPVTGTSTMFVNRAADMASMCPPCCGVYSWPAGLPTTQQCTGLGKHNK
ncbi:MAG TPA: hypothetical protein VN721_13090 [Flavipsychrobacter sp.]|nr:hypothetical protein [Flavipsychrobacter sp.]